MITRHITYFISFSAISLVVGCSTLPDSRKTSGYQPKQLQTDNFSLDLKSSDSKLTKEKLYTQYKKWQGVRYKLGGLSKQGIDCSGFVHITFKSKLGVNLPRTTFTQSKLGRKINQTELKAGDLVFFRTGPTSRHVGIYIENNKFLHASQSKGVIISHLDNVYWKAKYWKSIRV